MYDMMAAIRHGRRSGPLKPADAEPGPWAWLATGLRLIIGWACLAIGTLNLIVEIDRPSGARDEPYLIFHAVWLVGGITMLALAAIAPAPGMAGYVAAGVAAIAGLIGSAVPASTTVCCQAAFSVRHGYPFIFLARQDAGRWHVDVPYALVDLSFWAYLALFVLVVIALARRMPNLAEHLRQKTVRPLP